MEKILQDIISFLSNKDFYLPLIAVFFAWLLAFIPQKRQNIQQTIYRLMKNQMDLLNRIEFNNKKSTGFFIFAADTLEKLYTFISKDYEDITKSEGDFFSSQLNYETQIVVNEVRIGFESLKNFYIDSPKQEENETNLNFELRKSIYVYDYFFEYYYMYVGHYFRHLFNIVKYIKRNRLCIMNTKFYTGLIQAQMSAPELFVLFYNGLKFPRMEKFINNYKLIENLAKQDLMSFEHHKFYKVIMKERILKHGQKFVYELSTPELLALKNEFENKLNYKLEHLYKVVKDIEVSVIKGKNTSTYKGREFFGYINEHI